MQPESSSQSKANGTELDNTQCPNCHATLPRGLRFCRACGYRLGEGLEEYVETIRLKPRVSEPQAERAATDSAPNHQTTPFKPGEWGPVVQSGAAAQATGARALRHAGRRKKRGGWMLWMIIIIIMFSVAGGGILTPFALRRAFRGASSGAANKSSYFGVEGFKNADGGAFIDHVYPPGGPADKAGFIGGDVVVSFDGQPVKSGDDMQKLLAATPVGKTVDVSFLRDGQTRTTKLTTISREEFARLDDAFDNREDKGYLKEGSDIDRVIVPGMNIYGVRLNRIGKSGPADMAGIKDGDIVIEFDGIPTRTRRELELRIERAQPYSTVPVVIIRDGQRVDIQVKVGAEP
jgi:membrane-associated protease RseP (regulator of RpoE activity)